MAVKGEPRKISMVLTGLRNGWRCEYLFAKRGTTLEIVGKVSSRKWAGISGLH